MHDHAGTVMGGSHDSSLPHAPRSISPESTGSSLRMSSNTISGATQSSPTIISRRGRSTLLPAVGEAEHLLVARVVPAAHVLDLEPRALAQPLEHAPVVVEEVAVEVGDEARLLLDVGDLARAARVLVERGEELPARG